MPTFVRDDPAEPRRIDRLDGGVGWLAHPHEPGRRASHAISSEDRAWVFDAPGGDDLIAELGEVAGVAVLSDYHARDAGAVAARPDLPVHLPEWIARAAEMIDGPVEWFAGHLGSSDFEVRHLSPLPGWREGIAYRESDGTLYVPDVLGTAPLYTVDSERLGVYLLRRLRPPDAPLAGLDPDRILVGHGRGVFDDPVILNQRLPHLATTTDHAHRVRPGDVHRHVPVRPRVGGLRAGRGRR